jgi:AcrR family transcriptional regulator
MAYEKADQRVRYTKMVIKNSLLELMKEHPISKVTVTDICKQANINRNTFYSHYTNQFEFYQILKMSYMKKSDRLWNIL